MRLSRIIKRKSETTPDLLDSLKRVRITVSAGEIRLKRDLAECEDLLSQGISVGTYQHGDTMRFPLTIHGHNFTVEVPKFYPHHPPVIRILQRPGNGAKSFLQYATMEDHPCISHDGRLLHPLLTEEAWVAVFTMRDILLSVANFLAENNILKPVNVSNSPPMDMDL